MQVFPLARPKFTGLAVAGLLLRVNVPDHVVGQAIHLVASALRHLCKTFGFGLVLKRVRGEVDACID